MDRCGDDVNTAEDKSKFDYDPVIGSVVLAKPNIYSKSFYLCEIVGFTEMEVYVKWQIRYDICIIMSQNGLISIIQRRLSMDIAEINLFSELELETRQEGEDIRRRDAGRACTEKSKATRLSGR